jgi:HK97 family phage prohead protease
MPQVTDDRTPLLRTFAVELEVGDGRTVIGRCVPYGEIADVSDNGGPPYREAFVRGAFARACKAPHHVILDVEHSELVANAVGHGAAFADADDGLHGTFRMLSTPGADTALELIRAGVLTGLSVDAVPFARPRIGPTGEVLRTGCHLRKVALCRAELAAYAGARVEAVRTDDHLRRPAALEQLRPDRDDDLEARIAAYRDRTAPGA